GRVEAGVHAAVGVLGLLVELAAGALLVEELAAGGGDVGGGDVAGGLRTVRAGAGEGRRLDEVGRAHPPLPAPVDLDVRERAVDLDDLQARAVGKRRQDLRERARLLAEGDAGLRLGGPHVADLHLRAGGNG